jgi:hypothetical protein
MNFFTCEEGQVVLMWTDKQNRLAYRFRTSSVRLNPAKGNGVPGIYRSL